MQKRILRVYHSLEVKVLDNVRWRNNVRLKRWDIEVIPKSDSVGF